MLKQYSEKENYILNRDILQIITLSTNFQISLNVGSTENTIMVFCNMVDHSTLIFGKCFHKCFTVIFIKKFKFVIYYVLVRPFIYKEHDCHKLPQSLYLERLHKLACIVSCSVKWLDIIHVLGTSHLVRLKSIVQLLFRFHIAKLNFHIINGNFVILLIKLQRKSIMHCSSKEVFLILIPFVG